MFRLPYPVLVLAVLAWTVACSGELTEPTESRLVAIGDLHGDVNAARKAFRLAGVTDEADKWHAENLTVVQLGDMIGRSFQDREVLDFLLALQSQAAENNSSLHLLIGNHEVFGARLELRWVHDDAYRGFESVPDLDLDDPRLAALSTHQRPRAAALLPGGYYARRMSGFPAVLRIRGTVFVHGGVTPHWASYGVEKINEDLRRWFLGETDEPAAARGMDPGNFDDSVMMSRHFSNDDADCEMLSESLKLLNAKRMVVAHTVKETITSNCDGHVWAIDTGMSRFYGGPIEVLEIIDDSDVSVLSANSD